MQKKKGYATAVSKRRWQRKAHGDIRAAVFRLYKWNQEQKRKKEEAEKEAEKNISSLGDEIATAHSRAATDAGHYRALKEAEANQKKLTPEYIQYMQIMSLGNNTKVYFGNKLPNMLLSRKTGIKGGEAFAASNAGSG